MADISDQSDSAQADPSDPSSIQAPVKSQEEIEQEDDIFDNEMRMGIESPWTD